MSNNKFKVLVVEDEANICSFIETLLETNGYQAVVANTCARARPCSPPTIRTLSSWIWACPTGTDWSSSVLYGRSS